MTEKSIGNPVKNTGQTLEISPDLPTPNATSGLVTATEFDAIPETNFVPIVRFRNLDTFDGTRPTETEEFDDIGIINVVGEEVQNTFPLQFNKEKGATGTAYDMIQDAYESQSTLTIKWTRTDKSLRWATFTLSGARELPNVGNNLVLEAGITLQNVVRVKAPASTG